VRSSQYVYSIYYTQQPACANGRREHGRTLNSVQVALHLRRRMMAVYFCAARRQSSSVFVPVGVDVYVRRRKGEWKEGRWVYMCMYGSGGSHQVRRQPAARDVCMCISMYVCVYRCMYTRTCDDHLAGVEDERRGLGLLDVHDYGGEPVFVFVCMHWCVINHPIDEPAPIQCLLAKPTHARTHAPARVVLGVARAQRDALQVRLAVQAHRRHHVG
jgi:hypothetical protein